jgi:L-alanine-DL-glutamate epimerase-like enolase superfamily enzyme
MGTNIAAVEIVPVDMALHTPFGIATGAQVVAENAFVRITLDNGVTGTGEAAPFPAVNGETRAQAVDALQQLVPQLVGRDVAAWRTFANVTRPAPASARCAVETAVVDALCRHTGMPMAVFFGGATTRVVTDLTITTGTPEQAEEDARALKARGFLTIKLKVGGHDVMQDQQRLGAVARGFPGARVILDANGGLHTPEDANHVLQHASHVGLHVVLFEQPLHKDNRQGLAALVAQGRVPVAADESVTCMADVLDIAQARLANVINLKITKCGLVDALDMAVTARALGLGLMVGAMVESPVCIAASAALAAGLGGVEFVDLDTHLWMVDPPVTPGFVQQGPVLDLAGITHGHGAAFAGPRRSG